MGTRNVTIVIQGGETKIAQYGQWDGYPGGQGSTICQFLAEPENLDKLKTNLSKVRFLDDERDKDFMDAYNKNAASWSNEPDNRTAEQRRWFESYMTRDLGAGILESVANSEDAEILLKDESSFAGDGLMCEWAYVVDLDNEVVEVYKGFGQTPLTESDRFFYLQGQGRDNGYAPVKKIASLPFAEATVEAMVAADKDGDEEE